MTKHSKPRKYKLGELVSLEKQQPSTGQSKKLTPKFQGPYRITKLLDNDRYVVEDTPITRKGKLYSTVVSDDKIKPWLNFKRPHDDEGLSDGADDEHTNTI